MLDAKRIADVLGGAEVLGERITTLSALGAAVQRGLPKRSLPSVVRHLASEPSAQRKLIYAVVPEATYKRRKTRLNPQESERAERLARLVAMVESVWDDAAASQRFLTTPHRRLGGHTPLQMASQELGVRQVEEILAGIVYGLPA